MTSTDNVHAMSTPKAICPMYKH